MTTACGDQGMAESHSHLPQELSTKLASDGQGALELGDTGRGAMLQVGQMEATGGREPKPSCFECHLQTGLLTSVGAELRLCLSAL